MFVPWNWTSAGFWLISVVNDIENFDREQLWAGNKRWPRTISMVIVNNDWAVQWLMIPGNSKSHLCLVLPASCKFDSSIRLCRSSVGRDYDLLTELATARRHCLPACQLLLLLLTAHLTSPYCAPLGRPALTRNWIYVDVAPWRSLATWWRCESLTSCDEYKAVY